jgi:hypothetical protein
MIWDREMLAAKADISPGFSRFAGIIAFFAPWVP